MQDYNNRFATTPRSGLDFHMPFSETDNLDLVLCRKETRILSKNLTFQYRKTIYQIHVDRPSYAIRKTLVVVLEKPNHEVIVLYNNHPIKFDVYNQQQKQAEVVPSKSIDHAMINASKAHTPPPDHPWRKFNLKSNASSNGDILTLPK